MKIRFEKRDMKGLVTRISGYFQVCSEDGEWTTLYTKGSFRCPPHLYDRILTAITKVDEMIRKNQLARMKSLDRRIDCIWIVFSVENGEIFNVWVEYFDKEKTELQSWER